MASQRQKAVFNLVAGQAEDIKNRMLNWAKQFSIFLFANSNEYYSPYGRYECLLAAGVADKVQEGGLNAIQQLHNDKKDWLFGHICYDYKNDLEKGLVPRHAAKHTFPELHFFRPLVVCYIDSICATLTIESLDEDPVTIYKSICGRASVIVNELPTLTFSQRTGRNVYLDTVRLLKKHILNGDCYEINYCNEGFCNDIVIDPLQAYKALNNLSPAPFSAYYRLNDAYMMCASPERYLQKQGEKILSQPIKGTAPRATEKEADDRVKYALQNDVKERAENIMIVDLVRNDLARTCNTGSVHVDELFGIYSYPRVHQMISTVSGFLKTDMPFTEAIRYSFPMGSMTGAPKIKVMQLIDIYEDARRELFSGTVGYITPAGDFDFNVIIRSLFYNAHTKYLSYQAGGAITYGSQPEKEWEEMKLKAWAIEKIFS